MKKSEKKWMNLTKKLNLILNSVLILLLLTTLNNGEEKINNLLINK